MIRPQFVRCFTDTQYGVRIVRPREKCKDLAFMELIVGSIIASTLLLVGHLGVLVRNRLMQSR
jgi:hypothetical protein